MKRVIAISLLTIFLSVQINLTWAVHFCGSFEVESTMSLGKTDLSCGMETMSCCEEDSGQSSIPNVVNETCCSNDFYSSDADDFFEKSGNSIEKQLLFGSSLIISLFDFTQQVDENEITNASSPPLIQPDRQVMYQNFLL